MVIRSLGDLVGHDLMHEYLTNSLIGVEGLRSDSMVERFITHIEADQADQLSECERNALLLSLTYTLTLINYLSNYVCL